MFVLHERLAADCVELCRLGLSRLLLMNDARWPWLILVPERPAASELHHLDAAERGNLIDEVTAASRALEALYRPDKLNLGALGNQVPQLHLHVIARFRDDVAWPGPVWGHGAAEPYAEAALARRRTELQAALF